MEGKDLGGKGFRITLQSVMHVLADHQIAVLVRRIGEFHRNQRRTVFGASGNGEGGRTVSSLILLCYQNLADMIVAIHKLGDLDGRTCRNTGNVCGNIRRQGDGKLIIFISRHTGHRIAIGVGKQRCCSGTAGNIGQGHLEGVILHAVDRAIQLLVESKAGCGGNGEFAVVTQEGVYILLFAVFKHSGEEGVVQCTGGVIRCFGCLKPGKVAVHRAGRDVPVAVFAIIHGVIFQGDLRNGSLDHLTATFRIDVAVVMVAGTAGACSAGGGIAVFIVDHNVFGVIVAGVIRSRMEVGLCHMGIFYFVQIGDAIFVCVVADGPFVGVEGDSAVVVAVDMTAPFEVLCDLLLQIDGIDALPQTHFKHKTHRNGGILFEGFHCCGIVFCQSDIVLHSGQQGSGDLKQHSLVQGGKLCTDHYHHMHHIAVAVNAQIAVGTVGIDSIGRCIFVAGVLIPEAYIIAVRICIPANVVAPIAVIGVIELLIVISVVDQLLSLSGGGAGNPLLNSADQLIAPLGGTIYCTQVAVVHTLGNALAGVEDCAALAVIHQNTLYIGYLHHFTQFVLEGNIAGEIGVVTFHQSGVRAGFEFNFAEDFVKGVDQTICVAGVEVPVYVVHRLYRSIPVNTPTVIAGYDLHICTAVSGKEFVPVACQGIVGACGVQGVGGSGAVFSAQTQSQEKHVLGILRIFLILCCHTASDVSCSQLGHKGDPVGGGRAVANMGSFYIIIAAGGNGRRTVGHQHDNGHTLCTCLGSVLGDNGVDRIVQELIHCLIQTVLDICTAVGLLGGIGHIAAAFGFQTVLYRNIDRSAGGNIGGTFAGGLPAPAAISVERLCPPGGVQRQILAINAGIATQRQHHSGSAHGSILIGGGVAGVQHHAYTVVGILLHQLIDGGVGGIHHCFDQGHIDAIGSLIAVALTDRAYLIGVIYHRAGHIQHQHGIGGGGSMAGDGQVRGNGRQRNQEMIIVCQCDAGERIGSGGKDGFVRPDCAGKFCIQLVGAEIFLPAIGGVGIRFLAVFNDIQAGACGSGIQSEYRQAGCQDRKTYNKAHQPFK